MEDSNTKKDTNEFNNSNAQFLNDIYNDFFYLFSSHPEKYDYTSEAPKINFTNTNKESIEKSDEVAKTSIKEENNKKLTELYNRIENTHLTADSQQILKKMIEYAKKYNEKLTKQYIPFNMRIYCDNNDSLYEIVNIIVDGFTFYKYIKNDEAVERSFYVVEDSNHITELYHQNSSIVIFRDVQGLINKDKNLKDKLLNVLETVILDSSNINGVTTIISDTTNKKIDELFSNNPTLKDKIFDYELYTVKEDSTEVYQSILSSLKDYVLTVDFEVKLLDYVTETYPKTSLSAPEYILATVEKILFNQNGDIIEASTIPEFEKNKTIEEIFKELNQLIGLDNIKIALKDLVNLIQFKNKTKDSLKIKDTNLHMVFLGNPGTGKTTVARLVAGILYNLNYIEKNTLVEVSAKDLIGQYVGQTAPKTMSVIEKALGGVLFIDEAYSLASKPGNTTTFNEECIATLIQAMENYRDNLVVIFAGYSKEMDSFLKSNSGIISRIGYVLEFKDYSIDELISIFKTMFRKSGFIVDNSAIEKAKKIILEFQGTEGFGNARFIRNLYEKAIIKHATNMQNETLRKKLRTITANDITTENLGKLK